MAACRLVERLKWMSPQVFAELFALGSTLPGPTSTQVSFAVGAIKKGVPGGLLSGILFQYPGAFMMAGLGAGAANVLRDPARELQPILLLCASLFRAAVSDSVVFHCSTALRCCQCLPLTCSQLLPVNAHHAL